MNRVSARVGVLVHRKLTLIKQQPWCLSELGMISYKSFNSNTLVICDLRPW